MHAQKEKEVEREKERERQRERELKVKLPEQNLHIFLCIDNSNFLSKSMGDFTLPPKMCDDMYFITHLLAMDNINTFILITMFSRMFSFNYIL